MNEPNHDLFSFFFFTEEKTSIKYFLRFHSSEYFLTIFFVFTEKYHNLTLKSQLKRKYKTCRTFQHKKFYKKLIFEETQCSCPETGTRLHRVGSPTYKKPKARSQNFGPEPQSVVREGPDKTKLLPV